MIDPNEFEDDDVTPYSPPSYSDSEKPLRSKYAEREADRLESMNNILAWPPPLKIPSPTTVNNYTQGRSLNFTSKANTKISRKHHQSKPKNNDYSWAQSPQQSIEVEDLSQDLPRRYFLIKSSKMENIVLSQQDGLWATIPKNEHVLRNAFTAGYQVVLFFSVNQSGAFQGYADMISNVGQARTKHSWSGGTFGRPFSVSWKKCGSLQYRSMPRLLNAFNGNKPIFYGRDCQEIDESAGLALQKLFDSTKLGQLFVKHKNTKNMSNGLRIRSSIDEAATASTLKSQTLLHKRKDRQENNQYMNDKQKLSNEPIVSFRLSGGQWVPDVTPDELEAEEDIPTENIDEFAYSKLYESTQLRPLSERNNFLRLQIENDQYAQNLYHMARDRDSQELLVWPDSNPRRSVYSLSNDQSPGLTIEETYDDDDNDNNIYRVYWSSSSNRPSKQSYGRRSRQPSEALYSTVNDRPNSPSPMQHSNFPPQNHLSNSDISPVKERPLKRKHHSELYSNSIAKKHSNFPKYSSISKMPQEDEIIDIEYYGLSP